MNTTTRRRLRVYLPIIIVVILVVAIIAIILLSNRITAKDYFNALRNSSYTKQVQNTTIYEGELLVYEKIETIVKDGDNVYHKIEEKQLSAEIGADYEQTTAEFYYSKDKMYYFEDNVWKAEDFILSNKLKTYYLQTDYFDSIKYNKKIETEGCLHGKIKDSAVSKIVSGSDLKDMNLVIVVNKKLDVQTFDITAKTTTNRDVSINNVYTYFDESVILPV